MILSIYLLSFPSLLEKEVVYFFAKLCSISYVAIPPRSLPSLVGGRIHLHESDLMRNISRENWIWLDNWLVNKDRFFSKVRNVLSNIQYDSTSKI